ncbi:hypothetical protein FQA47_011623 [Oryzias melastigma]|uniref:Uncharacterized protein n=1 Tax=Oryzias melastigma TaxID=30732 RepID=A0A834F8K7_ORYME|nr:hypothetical protein FQA47_011623 [Oryzias melastigma]
MGKNKLILNKDDAVFIIFFTVCLWREIPLICNKSGIYCRSKNQETLQNPRRNLCCDSEIEALMANERRKEGTTLWPGLWFQRDADTFTFSLHNKMGGGLVTHT